MDLSGLPESLSLVFGSVTGEHMAYILVLESEWMRERTRTRNVLGNADTL